MRNVLILTILLVSCPVFTSCSKDGSGLSINNQLQGEWQWQRTDGGFAFNIHETPATTGNNIVLKIEENNQYSFSTNGIVTSAGTYTITYGNSIYDKEDKPFIHFSNDGSWVVLSLSTIQLSIADNANDGVGSDYTKKMK